MRYLLVRKICQQHLIGDLYTSIVSYLPCDNLVQCIRKRHSHRLDFKLRTGHWESTTIQYLSTDHLMVRGTHLDLIISWPKYNKYCLAPLHTFTDSKHAAISEMDRWTHRDIIAADYLEESVINNVLQYQCFCTPCDPYFNRIIVVIQ